VTVAIDPAPFRGVLPLPISTLRSSAAVLRNPANRQRAVPLTYEQFRYAFANAVDEAEAKELYESFAVPASGGPIFQSAAANLNPWTEAKVDTKNPERGPLLIISGEKDHTVPWSIANASYKLQQKNQNPTEIIKMARPRSRPYNRQQVARSRGHHASVRRAVLPTTPAVAVVLGSPVLKSPAR
jgi:non-heme chloroperoxidase